MTTRTSLEDAKTTEKAQFDKIKRSYLVDKKIFLGMVLHISSASLTILSISSDTVGTS